MTLSIWPNIRSRPIRSDTTLESLRAAIKEVLEGSDDYMICQIVSGEAWYPLSGTEWCVAIVDAGLRLKLTQELSLHLMVVAEPDRHNQTCSSFTVHVVPLRSRRNMGDSITPSAAYGIAEMFTNDLTVKLGPGNIPGDL